MVIALPALSVQCVRVCDISWTELRNSRNVLLCQSMRVVVSAGDDSDDELPPLPSPMQGPIPKLKAVVLLRLAGHFTATAASHFIHWR